MILNIGSLIAAVLERRNNGRRADGAREDVDVSRLKMRVYKLSADQLHLHRAEIIGGKVGVLDSFQYPQ